MNLRLKIALWLESIRRQNLKQIHPLQQLFWESTLRCNVHCLHCGSDCISSVQTPDMPAADFLKVIDTEVTPHVDPHKVLIIISGGEPLMRKDLANIGKALYQREYPWGMVTNGLALTEKKFRELRAAGLRSRSPVTVLRKIMYGFASIHWLLKVRYVLSSYAQQKRS